MKERKMKRTPDFPKDPPSDEEGRPAKDWPAATERALEELRRLIHLSGTSQRKLEKLVGFSKGYLSQLLARNLDLKVWHVLALLDALDQAPGEFFARVYPWRRRLALESFRRSSLPLSEETDELLGRLYRHGVDSLDELHDRVERCEQMLAKMTSSHLPGRKRGNGSS